MTTATTEQASTSISFTNGYTVAADVEIEMKCHDRQFRDTVFLDSSGARIFALDCPALFTSYHMKRTLRDAAGSQVLLMRHAGNTILEHWYIDDARGKRLCEAKGRKDAKSGATVIEAKVVADGGGEVEIDVESSDHAGTSTTFCVDGVAIAEMLLTTNNDLSFLGSRGLDRSGWKLKVQAGCDLALIAILAVCRAEVLHTYRR